MRDVVLPMVVLALGALRAAGQEPVPGAVPPTPAASGPPPPPLLVEPREPGLVPGQPTFDPAFEIVPAHRLAMMEAGQAMPANDPRVASAARRLERLPAGYLEDVPRIAELRFQVCGQIRAANRPASPSQMLDGALHWPRPATLPPAPPPVRSIRGPLSAGAGGEGPGPRGGDLGPIPVGGVRRTILLARHRIGTFHAPDEISIRNRPHGAPHERQLGNPLDQDRQVHD